MKYNKVLFPVLLMIVSSLFIIPSAIALDNGDTAPPLKVLDWVKNKPEKYLAAKEKGNNQDIVVLCFWATWSDTTDNLFRFLNTEMDVYSNENIVFIAMSKENQRIIDRFVRTDKGIKFAVAADDRSQTYDKYMIETSGVPMFFIIDKSGDLIWKGSPFEVDRVLSRVVTGTYNNEQEKEIESIRENLQRSIQYLNFDKQAEISEKILKIDPIDQMAINNIVDNYLRKNQVDEAIKYMLERIKIANYNKFVARALYFNLLTILQGMGNDKGKSYLKETIDQYYAAFNNNPEALNSFCIGVIQSMPMEIVPLKEVYDIMIHVIDLQKKLYPEQIEELGIYYRSLAKIYYLSGCLDKAVTAQEESLKQIEAAKNEDLATQSKLSLEYYKMAAQLQKTLK